jgi:Holliday junction DNA helicase RuvA
MIASLSGVLRSRNPTRVVLEAGGIGFDLAVPLSTSKALEAGDAESTTLLVQTVFTRQGVQLFGFATQDEKDTFNRLTGIKGIGPKAALNLLSRFTPAEIAAILNERKTETLKTVPGIGPKKAEMILGRRPSSSGPASAGGQAAMGETPAADLQIEQGVTALMSLGLTRAEALRRLELIPNRAELELSELLTRALKQRSD